MPWKETDRVKERIAFLEEYFRGGTSVRSLCRRYGISRPTAYRWIDRFTRYQSVEGLVDRSRRPVKSPGRTSQQVEEKVVILRKRYGWGARKLRKRLDEEYGIDLPVVTVHRILVRSGLVENRAGQRPSTRRFERENPNELWQMDFKGWYRWREGKVHPLGILDDASRYCLGLYALEGQQGDQVYARLVEVFRRYGLPEEMLVDHGTPWWSTTGGHGLTWLSVAIIKQGIRLSLSGVGHPQTQGKIERLNRTFDEWVKHHGAAEEPVGWKRLCGEFVKEYNWVRPHEAVSMRVPGEVYRPSVRKYMEQPPQWQYPVGSLVRRLNGAGCVEYEGRRRFVCEALRDEEVMIDRLEEVAVVTWRDIAVREIDLDSGRTRALVLPENNHSNV